MSNNSSTDEPTDNDRSASDEMTDSADTERDASFEEIAQTPVKERSGNGIIAWLALLVASLALLAFTYDFIFEGDAENLASVDDAQITALAATVQATRESMSTLEQSVSALSTLDGTRSAEVDALERQLEDRLRQLEALPGRVLSVEGRISSLQGVSTGARSAWLLAEAEYYMQIANAQLQLAGNPHLATLALTLADERVLQLADPGLVEVRRALSSELRALENMQKPDTEGMTLALASLARSVDSLPLLQEISLEADSDGSVNPDLTGVDRAVASLKTAFGKVVTVRRTDEALKPMIAPEAQYFLRANLALQLQAARLAMLRNEEALFAQSLDDAAAWLREYYETRNDNVISALATIAQIRGSVFSVAVPDISESLRLLRQFNNFSRLAATPDNGTGDDDAEESQTPDSIQPSDPTQPATPMPDQEQDAEPRR